MSAEVRRLALVCSAPRVSGPFENVSPNLPLMTFHVLSVLIGSAGSPRGSGLSAGLISVIAPLSGIAEAGSKAETDRRQETKLNCCVHGAENAIE